jgi:hypothetical protein
MWDPEISRGLVLKAPAFRPSKGIRQQDLGVFDTAAWSQKDRTLSSAGDGANPPGMAHQVSSWDNHRWPGD